MDKIFVKLGNTEFSAGLTYTALSRIKSLDKLCFKGLPNCDRFFSIARQTTFKRRKHYEEKIRPQLEQNFQEYSDRILSTQSDDSQPNRSEESGTEHGGIDEELLSDRDDVAENFDEYLYDSQSNRSDESGIEDCTDKENSSDRDDV